MYVTKGSFKIIFIIFLRQENLYATKILKNISKTHLKTIAYTRKMLKYIYFKKLFEKKPLCM